MLQTLQWKSILSQAKVLAQSNLKARYRNSWGGYLWVVLSPLSTFLVQAYVFKMIFKIDVHNYLLFLLVGLLPWLFFSQTVEMTITSIFNNSKTIKSLPIHPFSFIVSQLIDNLINNVSVLIILLVVISFFENVPWNSILLFPIPYVAIAIFTVAISFLLSALQMIFFDLKFIVSFLLSILFFLTPIIYPEKFVPPEAMFLVDWNPLNILLRPFRHLMSLESYAAFFASVAQSFLLAFLALIITTIIWRRFRNDIYLRL